MPENDWVGLQAVDRRITDVDERLAAHIAAQIEQVNESLKAAVISQDTAVGVVNDRLNRLQEYMEALMTEQRRAVEIAEREREKAALALSTEQRDARHTAELEREKAAEALRKGLERAMLEGDERLREHIENQFAQIAAALDSSEKLEVQRIQSVDNRISAVQEGLRQAQDSSDKAIQKAEAANDKRFEGVNEFRKQLNDQAALFLPRETFDTQNASAQRWRDQIDRRLNLREGGDSQQKETEAKVQPWALWTAGAAVTLVVALVVVLANVLTGA